MDAADATAVQGVARAAADAMAVQGVARAAADAMAVAAVHPVVTAQVAAMAAAMAADADAAEAVTMARLPRRLASRPALHARAAKHRQPMELLVPSATAVGAAREAETPQAAAKRAPRLPRPTSTTTEGWRWGA